LSRTFWSRSKPGRAKRNLRKQPNGWSACSAKISRNSTDMSMKKCAGRRRRPGSARSKTLRSGSDARPPPSDRIAGKATFFLRGRNDRSRTALRWRRQSRSAAFSLDPVLQESILEGGRHGSEGQEPSKPKADGRRGNWRSSKIFLSRNLSLVVLLCLDQAVFACSSRAVDHR
jgi:hypothetical protein